jgi:hypothetical protein
MVAAQASNGHSPRYRRGVARPTLRQQLHVVDPRLAVALGRGRGRQDAQLGFAGSHLI